MEAQKIKTARPAGVVGPFPSVGQLCEAKNIKLRMSTPRLPLSSNRIRASSRDKADAIAAAVAARAKRRAAGDDKLKDLKAV